MLMETHTMLELERMQQMLLSTHFALGEFLRSGTAIKYGIDNHGKTKRVTLQKRNVNLANKNEM